MFLVSDRRADTSIGRGAMHMARDEQLQHMGVVLDTSVRSPVSAKYFNPVAANATAMRQVCGELGNKEKVRAPQRLPRPAAVDVRAVRTGNIWAAGERGAQVSS